MWRSENSQHLFNHFQVGNYNGNQAEQVVRMSEQWFGLRKKILISLNA